MVNKAEKYFKDEKTEDVTIVKILELAIKEIKKHDADTNSFMVIINTDKGDMEAFNGAGLDTIKEFKQQSKKLFDIIKSELM